MKRLAPLALAFGLAGLIVSPALAETEQYREYGRCAIGTERDGFTDKITSHSLMCWGKAKSPWRHGPSFTVTCEKLDDDSVMLITEEESDFDTDNSIHVRYRWGKEKTHESRWRAMRDGKGAIDWKSETVERFLEGMSSTNGLLFEVGIVQKKIKITETERAAIPDFKARCGKE